MKNVAEKAVRLKPGREGCQRQNRTELVELKCNRNTFTKVIDCIGQANELHLNQSGN
jgi:hypothetical protein